ncbi:MAG: RNA polymerase sigma factor [Paracoccaceae bacterium]
MSTTWLKIRENLLHKSSRLPFQRAFDAIRHDQAALTPFRDPAALLDSLQAKTGDPIRKNEALQALVRAAQGAGPASDCALTLLLLALWPGLDAIRRRSCLRKFGAADEIASDVLARTTEVVRGLDLGRVNRIAATVLKNIERDMMRAQQRHWAEAASTAKLDRRAIRTLVSPPEHAPAHARLVGEMHRVIGHDTALVNRVALEGFSQVEAAGALGLTEAAARKRYQRATRMLRERITEIV